MEFAEDQIAQAEAVPGLDRVLTGSRRSGPPAGSPKGGSRTPPGQTEATEFRTDIADQDRLTREHQTRIAKRHGLFNDRQGKCR